MSRIWLILFFLTSMGCSADAMIEMRSQGCETEKIGYISVAFCGPAYRDAWRTNLIPMIDRVDEEAVERWFLPPPSEHMDNQLIRVYSGTPGEPSGVYKGYGEPETNTIEVYMNPFEQDMGPQMHSTLHEIGHLYDHREMGVHTLPEWHGITERGRHFLVPIMIQAFVVAGRGNTHAVIDEVRCGLVDEMEEETDGGQ